MAFLKVVLILIEVLCSLLLIGVILLQKSKGEGLGMAFGAELGESLFGARAANVLVKITIWLGIIFMLNTIFLAKIYSRSQERSVIERVAAPTPSAPDAMMPGGVAPETVAPPPATAPLSIPAPSVEASAPVEAPASASPAGDLPAADNAPAPSDAPPLAESETTE